MKTDNEKEEEGGEDEEEVGVGVEEEWIKRRSNIQQHKKEQDKK